MDWLVETLVGDQDLTGWAERWTVVAYSSIFFLCVYVTCLLLSSLSATYRILSNREKVFWHLSIVRAVFGLCAIYIGIYTFFVEHELHADVINGTTRTSSFNINAITGFFVFECAMLFGSNIYFGYFDWNLALHHLLALIASLLAVYYNKAHFIGTMSILLEMTTPFSALCWLLIKAKMADTRLWRVNQIVLIHLFHCRTNIELYIWWVTYQNFAQIWNEMPAALGVVIYVELALITTFLTPFWTYKKTWQYFNPVDWNHLQPKKKSV